MVVMLMSLLLGDGVAAPLGGTTPDRRPEGAPKVLAAPERTRKPAGIPPDLSGLGFVRDQGNWYTPFDRPGMPPPYDLRGWHRKP